MLAVVAFAALFGVGHNDSAAKFFKGDAWLPSNDSGSVVRVNGATGKPDFEMRFKDAKGADLQVIQGLDGVFVLNRDTGEVTKLDDAQLQLGGSVKADPADNPAFLIGGGKGFLVSQRTGRVQQVDPSKATLDPVGGAVELKHPISNAVVDPRGRLAAAISETGELAFVADGKADAPVRVADPNDELRVSLVDDQLFAVDHSKATVAPVDPTTGVQTVYTIDVPRDGKLVVTEKMTGPRLWLLHVQTARLVGIDVTTGRQSKIDLDEVKGHELGAPLPNGLFVYVPDYQLGALLKIDPETGKILDRARVVDSNDPNRDAADGRIFTAFVKDDRVWGNDPRGQVAVVIDREGNAQQIEKYREGLPTNDDLKPLPDALPPTSLPKAPVTTAPKQDPRPDPKDQQRDQPEPQDKPQDGPTTTRPGDLANEPNAKDGDQQKRTLPGVPDPGGVTEKAPNGATGNEPATPGATPTPPPPAANVPSAPQGVQASPGDGSATVTWMAPADNGSPITGYTVADAKNGVSQKLPATATTANVTDLTNGTTYTFTVSAANAIGTGPAAAALPVTPATTLPGAPTNFTTGYLSTSAGRTDYWPQLQWGAPATNAPLVDHYQASCAPPAATPGPPVNVPVGSGGPYTYVFQDLPLGVAVTCWVQAVDKDGRPGARASMPAGATLVPWGTPDPAINTAVTTTSNSAQIRWNPDFDGGRPISGYEVVIDHYDGSTWAFYTDDKLTGAGSTTLNLAGIPLGDYRAQIYVINRDAATGNTTASVTPNYLTWTIYPMATTTIPVPTSSLSGFAPPSAGGSDDVDAPAHERSIILPPPTTRPAPARIEPSKVLWTADALVALFLKVSSS